MAIIVKKSIMAIGLLAMLGFSVAGYAVYLHLYTVEATVTATTTGKIDTWTIDIVNISNAVKEFSFPSEQAIDTKVTLYDSVVSTDPNCEYMSGEDLRFFWKAYYPTEHETELFNATAIDGALKTGDNFWNVTVSPSPMRCPLAGTFTIVIEEA